MKLGQVLTLFFIYYYNIGYLSSQPINQILPYSQRDNIVRLVKNNEHISKYISNKPNVDSIIFSNHELEKQGYNTSNLYGVYHEETINLKKLCTFDTLPSNDIIWRTMIVCPDAYSINLAFKDVKISENTKLIFYSPDLKNITNFFGNEINNETGIFATSFIWIHKCIIEIICPIEEFSSINIILSRIVYGYKDIKGEIFKSIESQITEKLLSASCNRDVNCPEGNDWCREKSSIAIVSAPQFSFGYGWCTGSLINNTENDYTPYFLSAFHCLDNAPKNQIINETEKQYLHYWSFRFRYMRVNCGYDSNYNYKDYSGATFISAWNYSDFLL